MEVPRRSLAASLSPLRLIDPRRSFSYNQMPEEPIKLTVLKLDGSSFDVEVLKKATVRELKMAVEAAFSHLPFTVIGNVSWPHVWVQFCLSFGDQRLINESDYLIEFGIKDGDQSRASIHPPYIKLLHLDDEAQEHDTTTCFFFETTQPSPSHDTYVRVRPSTFSIKTETWKKKRAQGQEDGVHDSITQIQPSFLSTVLGGWLSHKSSPSKLDTKHRDATASTSSHRRVFNKLITRFRFKCYSEKDGLEHEQTHL
ncbi:unnamed protein product [Eruca vesicaria subsp. sativa]|uniref:SNRNP25 ubiquitin-like domain-containing protein n=1 Tax=Eruca vesicaria subsp. sativa TaxID=29727 RepID=A0ABC8J5V0_ERUVS|nr:unnamed protein product [Eruca vesicaria subsp. sativa]